MSASTHSTKAANDNAEPNPLLNEEVYSLKSEVLSLKSYHGSKASKIQFLQMELSSPPPASPPFPSLKQHTTSTYDQFMQEPYCVADCFDQLRSDGSNLTEWLTFLNRVLFVAFNLQMLINNFPSSINNCSPEENRQYVTSSMPPYCMSLRYALVSLCHRPQKGCSLR
ncbi:hypothetical protein O181_083125 [Austropuccinia psidii MF-1]|uniref:Uncharacterized protein n=1 Tax=Austropuccinia psidii MF-1 TaxID=1389203 RepID=A0A9Q3FT62_9BASI|nr:hypothetical protein [Austropuccinia psidii MF-1]